MEIVILKYKSGGTILPLIEYKKGELLYFDVREVPFKEGRRKYNLKHFLANVYNFINVTHCLLALIVNQW